MPDPPTCPACGAALSPRARFCSECGGKAPPGPSHPPDARPGERRQVTILFADITGYTRLSSEIDPEELHGLLGRYFDVVDRIIQDFGGTVDKHIGDAVMGVFGAPVSHGNDPERAVRAALGVHAAMGKLSTEVGRAISVHIGVANGEVVAASTGSDVHREYTVLGDAVNLASRLDGVAGPGETVISHRVQQAVADLVDVVSGGEVQVKGLADPVRVFRVRGLRERDAACASRLVGRQAEVELFSGLLAAASLGTGAVLQLRGEPGIGKTRLAAELRGAAVRGGFQAHQGLVLDFGTGRGQDAVRAVVRSVLGLSLDATLTEREEALADALGRTRLDPDAASAARDLLGLPQPPALRGPYEALSEARRAEVKGEAVVRLLEYESQAAPLLVLVEDVHWADEGTRGALAAIADLTRRARLVLLLTSRVDGDPLGDAFFSGAGAGNRHRIELGPLTREAAEQLGERFGGIESQRLQACVERSGGNPLFLEQLLLSDEEGTLPDTVQSLVQARMDRLAPADKRALQAASVIGQRFSLDLLRHLLEEPTYRCDALQGRDLARPEGEDWLFSHALVRDGAYSSLLRQTRRSLHRRAATWFGTSDPVLRAEHLDRAEDDLAPRAYLDAARARIEALEYEEAHRLLRRGRQLAADEGDRHALALREGELLLYRADSRGAIAAFDAAVHHARSALERCRAYIGMADAHRIVEAADQARESLSAAERLLEPGGMDAERSRLHRVAGSVKFSLAEDSRVDQELALEHALRAADAELEARALSCVGDAHYMAGSIRRSREYFTRCIDLCDRHGLSRVGMYQHYMLGFAEWLEGDCLAGIRSTERGRDLAMRAGHARAEMVARETLGMLLTDAGDYQAALSELEQASALAERVGSRGFAAVLLAERADTLLRMGRTDEARALAGRVPHDLGGEAWWFVRPMIVTVRAALSRDLAEMDALLDAWHEQPIAPGMMTLLFLGRACDVCIARGNDARAARYARALIETDCDAASLAWTAERTLALVAYRAGSRDPLLLGRLAELRTQAVRGGFRFAVSLIDGVTGSGDRPEGR